MTEKDENLLEGFVKGEAPKVVVPPGVQAGLEARAAALTAGDPVCPACKVRLVLRIAQSGPKAGGKFWGCPNYPKCRFTIEFPEGKV